MAVAIDTLAYARRLREVGFSEQQAEGQAEALAAAMTDALATKQDLREMETHIDARFVQVDARFTSIEGRFAQVDARFSQVDARFAQMDVRLTELDKHMDERMSLRLNEQTALFRAEMADLERRMTMRLGGITVAGIGVVSALVKVL